MMQRLSACVVMYGHEGETRRCLKSLKKHTKGGLGLFLVDNASPNGALQRLKDEGIPEGAVVIACRKNRGYGAGHNRVLPLLRSKYHVVSNPDIEIYDDVLNKMADWMDAHPDVGMACPRLLFPKGQEQHIAKRRPALLPLIQRQLPLPFRPRAERHYLMLDEDLSQPIDVEFCSGSFFMIRTAVFKSVGGFDERYFMYVEDADLTQKVLRRWRAVFLPQVSVTHLWRRDAHKKPRQFFWQLKSMLRYFKKWGFKWN